MEPKEIQQLYAKHAGVDALMQLREEGSKKRVYIEEVSSPEQIEEAKKIRREQGKHVVPVPTFEIKEQFSGYFMDPLKMFEKKDRVYKEKSVIRPTFSYLGNYTISFNTLSEIV